MLLGARTVSLFGERFFRQEIGKVFCPVHVEWGTIGPNPVFLRASPVGFPKRATPLGSGISMIFTTETL